MSIIRRRHRDVPGLNTASLPDLIFTVLFFFMIVTHMQTNVVRVHYQVPQGKNLSRQTSKQSVTYIFAGSPTGHPSAPPQIQLGDKTVTPSQLANLVAAQRSSMSPDEQHRHIVVIKADRHIPMSLLRQIKDALRQAGATRVIYTANEKKG